jgi:hypothetical protein
MTCIAGIEHGGRVWLGGDSAVSSEDGVIVSQRTPKVWRTGPLVVGCCGNSSWEGIWRRISFPRAVTRDVDAWVANELHAAVTGMIGDDTIEDSAALVGIGARLYYVEPDGNAWRAAGGYCAAGTGDAVALGSLHTTARRKLLPRYRLTLALQAAATHCTTVAPPFRFVNT